MDKFCENCGTPIDPVTGNCPKCQPGMPKSPKSKNKIIIPIVAVPAVLIAVTAALLIHFGVFSSPRIGSEGDTDIGRTEEVIVHEIEEITIDNNDNYPGADERTTRSQTTAPRPTTATNAPKETSTRPETTAKEKVTSKPDAGYASLYADLLKSRLSDGNVRFMTFGLVYIDSDKIPELAVSNGESHFSNVDIYTIRNNRCVKLGSVGSSGSFSYVPYGNLVESENSTNGGCNCEYFKISGSSLEKIRQFFFAEDIPGYDDEYKIDNVSVSKSEFDSALYAFSAKYNFKSFEHDNTTPLTSGNVSQLRNYPERFTY